MPSIAKWIVKFLKVRKPFNSLEVTRLTSAPDWKALPALELFTQIVCQVSNRVFVGLPVCEYHCHVA